MTCAHLQVLIDAAGTKTDELIAPLVGLVRRHGLTVTDSCQGDTDKAAFLTFPSPAQALEFVLQTQHYFGYNLGDNLALTVLPPTGDEPGGKASWPPEATVYLINAWGGS